MKKTKMGYALWIFFHGALVFAVPLGVCVFVPEPPLWLIGVLLAWTAAWSRVMARVSVKHEYGHWQNDCLLFAHFIRQFRNDDPILANAVWKKAHPNITPPWVCQGQSDQDKPVVRA